MAPFKLSLDAKLLLVPMSAAGMLLIGMVSRIPTRDPEASRSGMAAYDDEMKAAAVGSRYANEIAGLFDVRIKARAFGIFDNDVKAQ